MKKYLNSPLCWVMIIALFTIALNFGGNCYAEDGDFKEIVTIHWSNNLVGSGTVDESYVSVPGVSSVDSNGVCSGGVSFTAPSGYKIIGFVTGTKVHTMPLYYRLVYTGAGTVVNPGVYYPLPDNTTYFYFYHTNGAAYTLEVRNVVIYLEHTQNISGIGEAKAAAEAAAQAAAEASASASASAKTLNAPLITQFQVNGGALEKEGTGIVKAIFRAQNSPTNASWDKIQYRITRVNSTGTETELVDWTNFDVMLFSRGEADIQPIAGMNNLILYVKNTTSGAISKANTTLIAGTISDRDPALESYYGGMYGATKESRDYAGYAAIMADAANTSATQASAYSDNILRIVEAPIISQFDVNNGALERDGVGSIPVVIRAQYSPMDTKAPNVYKICRLNNDGTETQLTNGNFDGNNKITTNISVIAGINNLVLYASSWGTSKATATVIAGTVVQRETALKAYYGGMYSELKDSTYGLSALKSLIDTVNGVAGQAKTAASNANINASSACNAVQAGSTSAIGVLTDTTKGLTQTYDKANAAATNASAAATNSSTAASSANTAASRALTTINNTQANDGGTTKSAAALAKEAKDSAGTAVTQLTSGDAGTIRADLTEIKDRITAIIPVIHSVKGQNGATCTTGTTFIVVISASNATQYCARLSGGSWTSWGSNNTITVSVGGTAGPKTIEVQARSSPTGTPASDSITIFKIVQ